MAKRALFSLMRHEILQFEHAHPLAFSQKSAPLNGLNQGMHYIRESNVSRVIGGLVPRSGRTAAFENWVKEALNVVAFPIWLRTHIKALKYLVIPGIKITCYKRRGAFWRNKFTRFWYKTYMDALSRTSRMQA